jgi:hypothetical protein
VGSAVARGDKAALKPLLAEGAKLGAQGTRARRPGLRPEPDSQRLTRAQPADLAQQGRRVLSGTGTRYGTTTSKPTVLTRVGLEAFPASQVSIWSWFIGQDEFGAPTLRGVTSPSVVERFAS